MNMDIVSILISLVLGAIAGWLAGFIMNSKGSLLRDIIIGIIGGFLGSWLFNLLGISFAGYLGVIIESAVGACILLFAARFLLGNKR
jgi:uncharacterized membrane protein YeaQ/YmgE (transglycosylase-associated protein family)